MQTEQDQFKIQWLPLAAAALALVGLIDAIYLTVNHFNGASVQCMEGFGCEQVLTSDYASVAGVPLAMLGAISYFAVFSLATLAAFGNQRAWTLFGALVGLMSLFTLWLLYLQAFVIGAFCQFCLISAAVTLALLVIAVSSRYFFKRLA